MIGKLKSMIQKLRGDVISYAPLKGLMVEIEGAGGSDPVINTQYNITTVTRTSVGIYNIVPIQVTVFGDFIDVNSTKTTGFSIVPSAVSEAHFVSVTPGAGNSFDIKVNELTLGGGNKLEVNPYDILAGDTVSVNIFINAGDGRLPPA